MRILLFCFLLSILFYSCSNTKNEDVRFNELESLQSENDSLRKALDEINEKYVFDSISVRDIPSYDNQYSLNSIVSGEIVFVGYNLNDRSQVISFDSINYENEFTLINPETLVNINGGYRYEKLLVEEFNSFNAYLKTENNYGKKFESSIQSTMRTNKN